MRPPVDGEDAGNELGIFLPNEDGSIENSLGGSSRPATPLIGLLGSGDSGGSAWMKTKAGWLLVGVNSNGTGEATYGETSWFCRVSPAPQVDRLDLPGHPLLAALITPNENGRPKGRPAIASRVR